MKIRKVCPSGTNSRQALLVLIIESYHVPKQHRQLFDQVPIFPPLSLVIITVAERGRCFPPSGQCPLGC